MYIYIYICVYKETLTKIKRKNIRIELRNNIKSRERNGLTNIMNLQTRIRIRLGKGQNWLNED